MRGTTPAIGKTPPAQPPSYAKLVTWLHRSLVDDGHEVSDGSRRVAL